MSDKKTVLLVDDDDQITSTLKIHLEEFAEIEIAHTYEDGLVALKKAPDLAVIDIALGAKSGLELLREAKNTGTLSSKIIVLTNSLQSDHLAEAMELGITSFIQKADHDPEDIAGTIKRQLQG